MVPLETVFLGLMIFFGIIGALRGWAKEMLVTFAAILSRFIEMVMREFVPVLGPSLRALEPKTFFYVRIVIFIFVIFFGYATTVMSPKLNAKARKDKLQDALLGFFLGALNGFIVVGIFWGFLHQLGYGLWGISAPQTAFAQDVLKYLPLAWLEGGLLYVSVAISFALVLIVFV